LSTVVEIEQHSSYHSQSQVKSSDIINSLRHKKSSEIHSQEVT